MSKFQIGDVVKFMGNSGSGQWWSESNMTGVVTSEEGNLGLINVQCRLRDGRSVCGTFKSSRWELSEEPLEKERPTIQDAIELVEVNEQLAEARNDLENAKNEVEFLEKRFKALAYKLGIE
ncbi:hypothetical protein 16Q_130 [Pseudomonas phage 16Q]|nr:hypothetical protein 16Q_130 [Pseudomonas phage 16Q]